MCRLLLVVLCLWSVQLGAHTGMAVTIPDHDAVLAQAPTQLVFSFMGQVTLTNIHLENAAGVRIDLRLPRNSIGQSTAFGETITLPLPLLAPEVYRVTWQAVSVDGHSIVDDFSFTVSQ